MTGTIARLLRAAAALLLLGFAVAEARAGGITLSALVAGLGALVLAVSAATGKG